MASSSFSVPAPSTSPYSVDSIFPSMSSSSSGAPHMSSSSASGAPHLSATQQDLMRQAMQQIPASFFLPPSSAPVHSGQFKRSAEAAALPPPEQPPKRVALESVSASASSSSGTEYTQWQNVRELATNYIHAQDPDAAIAFLTPYPPCPPILNTLALAYLAKLNIEKALSLLSQSLELAPYDIETLRFLTREHLGRGNYAEALHFAERWYQATQTHLSKLDPIALSGIIRAYIGLAQFTKAKEHALFGAREFPTCSLFPRYLDIIENKINEAAKALLAEQRAKAESWALSVIRGPNDPLPEDDIKEN